MLKKLKMPKMLTRNKILPCLAIAFLMSLFSGINQDARAETKRPNILFIFADDWGWGDLSCHGHPYVKTPNIDRLAKEGTDFHRFTVASGVCSPSRTAVMTGHFPARYNIDGHFAWVPSNAKRGMPDWLDTKAPTLPRFLQQAGYATAHYGKWHLANDMIPDSPNLIPYGYDEYGAFNCSGEQMPVHDDAKHSIAFIRKAHKAGKPFFINLWVHEPHTPFHTLPAYRKRFPELNDKDNIYASVLSHADDRIGEVLDVLDELKIADNSLVIFSSDNGPARSSPDTPLKEMYDTATGKGWNIAAAKGITGGRRGFKSSLMEGGIGVPFIVRWPGKVAANKIDNHSMISGVDLLPTLCDAAGVKLPDSYQSDGESQLAALKGSGDKKVYRHKPLFWRFKSPYPGKGLKKDHWVSYAIVHENWKLCVSHKFNHVELYDLDKDAYEKTDLSNLQPEVTQRLLKQVKGWLATLPQKPSGDVFSRERTHPTEISKRKKKKS